MNGPQLSHAEKVQRLRRYYEDRNRFEEELRKLGYQMPAGFVKFPEACRDMRCEARTRSGEPCKRRDLYNNWRCKLHGGLSTGPRTKRGKRRAAKNGLLPKRRRRVDPEKAFLKKINAGFRKLDREIAAQKRLLHMTAPIAEVVSVV